jgi:hypothetical protein
VRGLQHPGVRGQVLHRAQAAEDFYGYIGKERHRTTRKMQEFRDMVSAGGWVGLVVEATEADLLTGYIMSRVSPETARQALVSFEIRYGSMCTTAGPAGTSALGAGQGHQVLPDPEGGHRMKLVEMATSLDLTIRHISIKQELNKLWVNTEEIEPTFFRGYRRDLRRAFSYLSNDYDRPRTQIERVCVHIGAPFLYGLPGVVEITRAKQFLFNTPPIIRTASESWKTDSSTSAPPTPPGIRAGCLLTTKAK